MITQLVVWNTEGTLDILLWEKLLLIITKSNGILIEMDYSNAPTNSQPMELLIISLFFCSCVLNVENDTSWLNNWFMISCKLGEVFKSQFNLVSFSKDYIFNILF